MECDKEKIGEQDNNTTEHIRCLPQPVVARLVSFFKVMGDETRIKIIYALSQKEMCVSEIAQVLDAAITQSAISHQLRQLKLEGLVKSRREGKNIFYSLDDEHIVGILDQSLVHILHKLNMSE